jgi:SH3-like domain-containing protein
VVAEYGTWRKVKDMEGSEGWVHQGMLSHKRAGIVTTPTLLYKKMDGRGQALAKVDSKVCVSIKEIKPAWCKVTIGDKVGWINRNNLWGVLKNE